MAEHYLDLAVAETSGTATQSPTQRAAVRLVEDGLKRAVPSYRAVVERCSEVGRGSVSCALDATTTAAWEACVHAADGAAVIR